MKSLSKLRILFVAGTLTKGGAEKQLFYVIKSLRAAGSEVLLLSLTNGEYWQKPIEDLGVPVVWVGQNPFPVFRLLKIFLAALKFSPNIIQSQHFYTNLYTALVSRILGIVDIGAIRSNVTYEMEHNKFWGTALLYVPRWLCANSCAATKILVNLKQREKVLTLLNTIDLKNFDQLTHLEEALAVRQADCITVVTVARLVKAKRLDRLLKVAALLQTEKHHIQILIIGDGPERENLDKLFHDLNLSPNTIRFLGARDDIPQILLQGDIFALTSDDEGFPNALLEAMSARLPVVTTPAGDCSNVVINGVTGYIVDFDDITMMAERILFLSCNPMLRKHMGNNGRVSIEKNYSLDQLHSRLLEMYGCVLDKSF